MCTTQTVLFNSLLRRCCPFFVQQQRKISVRLAMPFLASAVAVLAGAGAVAGQYFPPTPEGLKVVHSKQYEGVKISYKEVSLPRYLVHKSRDILMLTVLPSPEYAKPLPASNHTRATSIFPREHSIPSALPRTIPSIPSSGFSSPGIIPLMHRFLSG